MRNFALIVSIAFITSACVPPQHGPADSRSNTGVGGTGVTKKQIGTIAGALGGAFAGSNIGKGKGKTVGVAAGTLLGAMIGGSIGESLDRADRMYYKRTAQNALESTTTGTQSKWINPDSGNSGTVTPTRTFQTSSGQYCREFTQEIIIDGRKDEAYGTACRQDDGSWKVVNK